MPEMIGIGHGLENHRARMRTAWGALRGSNTLLYGRGLLRLESAGHAAISVATNEHAMVAVHPRKSRRCPFDYRVADDQHSITQAANRPVDPCNQSNLRLFR